MKIENNINEENKDNVQKDNVQEEIVGVSIMKEAMKRVLEIKQLRNIQEQCLKLMKQKAEGGINEYE